MGDEGEPPPPEANTPQAEETAAVESTHGRPSADVRPSKSALVDKRASTMSKQMSHVKLVEPGEETPTHEEERRKSEIDKRKSADEERRTSEAARKSRQLSTASAGYRASVASQRTSIETGSKEGILRRRSDRPSKAKSAVGSTISITRASGYGEYLGGTKAPKYMNTYKLDSDNPFHVEKVEKILRDVLTEALENLTYDPDKCPKQAKWACSAIRAKVKEQDYDRYKLVCIVTIGEKRYQDMCSVVRFLWDCERDKYALFVHENMHVYASALCFGLYYE